MCGLESCCRVGYGCGLGPSEQGRHSCVHGARTRERTSLREQGRYVGDRVRVDRSCNGDAADQGTQCRVWCLCAPGYLGAMAGEHTHKRCFHAANPAPTASAGEPNGTKSGEQHHGNVVLSACVAVCSASGLPAPGRLCGRGSIGIEPVFECLFSIRVGKWACNNKPRKAQIDQGTL